MSEDKDVNLLPKNLRSREQAEWQKPITKKPEVKYSQPSVLAERLKEAEQVEPGVWNKIKSWFNKVPPPVKVSEPLDQTKLVPTKKEVKLEQPVRVSWKEKIFGAGAAREEVIKTKTDVKTDVPTPQELPAEKNTTSSETPSVPLPAPTLSPDIPVGVVLDVNLLPFSSRPTKTPIYLKKLGLVAVAALVLVGIIYGLLATMIMYKRVEVKKVQDDAKVVADSIDAANKDLTEIGLVSKQMAVIKDLAKQRTLWLKLLDKLEELTLPNVSYGSMSVTSEGIVVLPTQALTVSDVAKQMQVFQQATDVFSDVIISSVSVGSGTEGDQILVSTSFQLKVKPDWLRVK